MTIVTDSPEQLNADDVAESRHARANDGDLFDGQRTVRPGEKSKLIGTDRALLAIGTTVMCSLLMVFGVSVANEAARSRDNLADRFEARASLTASFVTGWVNDLADRETAQATRLLSDSSVPASAFEQMVLAFDFDAAVLLDDGGRLLAVSPSKPEILGQRLDERYAHLAAAVAGGTGVSGVVPSVAEGSPIVAVAIPFQSEVGRRVFSGAFDARATPLGVYFENLLVTTGSAYLVDAEGNVVVAGHSVQQGTALTELTASQLDALDDPIGSVEIGGAQATYARAPVADTYWSVVLITRTSEWFSPIEGSARDAWILFSAFAVTGIGCIITFLRLMRAHSVAATGARIDALTQLPNRRAIDEHLNRAAANSRRHQQPYGILLIDVDNFKAINDTDGHLKGDEVIRRIGAVLRASARTADFVGRWGGDEFIVIVTSATVEELERAGMRLRVDVATAMLGGRGDSGVPGTTISVGGACDIAVSPTHLAAEADRALFEAKRSGRDAVVVFGGSMAARTSA